jgi:sec-independent protein translocase protein TatA
MEGLLSPVHLVIILVIVLVLFGPGKLPDLGKGLGKGIREFKDAMRSGTNDKKDDEKKVEVEKKDNEETKS